MPSKWSDLSPWRQKQENSAQSAPANAPATAAGADRAPARADASLDAAARADKSKSAAAPPADAPGSSLAAPQGDLLSMDDIYRAAGILTPRMGYSIRKVADMLASDHLRGLSDDMKRASTLMALDAAGIPVDEVLRDASLRQSAINSYESEQWQHFEEHWAAKAAENAQIQAELDRVTAQFQERIKRNLDEVAQEKVVFAQWQTAKEREAQRIGEAAAICAKPSIVQSMEAPQPSHRAIVAGGKPN